MGYAPKWSDVQKMPDDELRDRYDAAAKNTVVGTAFWREELTFRMQMRAANEAHLLNVEVANLTRRMERMTWALVVLTLLAVLVGAAAIVVAVAA